MGAAYHLGIHTPTQGQQVDNPATAVMSIFLTRRHMNVG